MWLMFFKIVVWSMLGLVCWLNLQPWLDVGAWLAGSGLEFPFMDLFMKVPFLRGIVTGIVTSAASLFAVGLWLIVQTLQVMALIAESPAVQNAFAKLFRGIPLSQWIATNSTTVGRLGWGGYLLEGFVSFLAYPPYGSGFSDLAADAGNWDPYLISWEDIALFSVTILMFEGFVWLACFFYGALSMGSTTRSQSQSAPRPQPKSAPRPQPQSSTYHAQQTKST